MSTFGDYVDVSLGHQALLNDFFHVDKARIDEFRIERQFLLPIFRLKDLDNRRYMQTSTPVTWLFSVDLEPRDLFGTGAWKYIEWGERQETAPKKQSSGTVRWPDAYKMRIKKHWYWLNQPPVRGRIAMRKGIDRQYAPYLFEEPVVLDQRLYLLEPRDGVDEQVLKLFLCSSLFALALEASADMGLGDGVLTMGANTLRGIPSIDLRRLSSQSDLRDRLAGIDRRLRNAAPPTSDTLTTSEVQIALDSIFLSALGLEESRVSDLHYEVAKLAGLRRNLAGARKRQRVQHREVDIESAADAIVRRLHTWFEGRRFPDDYINGINGSIDLPGGPLSVETSPLFDRCTVRIVDSTGAVRYEGELERTSAEVLLRSLQLGRRHFAVCSAGIEAESALAAFQALRASFDGLLGERILESGVGGRYRAELERRVSSRLRIDTDGLHESFDSRHQWRLSL